MLLVPAPATEGTVFALCCPSKCHTWALLSPWTFLHALYWGLLAPLEHNSSLSVPMAAWLGIPSPDACDNAMPSLCSIFFPHPGPSPALLLQRGMPQTTWMLHLRGCSILSWGEQKGSFISLLPLPSPSHLRTGSEKLSAVYGDGNQFLSTQCTTPLCLGPSKQLSNPRGGLCFAQQRSKGHRLRVVFWTASSMC